MTSQRTKKEENKIDHRIDHQLRVLFDNADEYKICQLDVRGDIIGWNLGAERLTGYKAEDVIGKNYSMFGSEEEREKNTFKKVLATAKKQGQFTAEGIRVRKDGTHFWVRSHITPLMDDKGRIKFFVVITRDISQERMLTEKREEYIGIASHELKNPLTTLSLYSELLSKGLELEGSKKNLQMLRDIQAQTARLVALVDDLLIVSKLEAGTLELHKEDFDPNKLVAETVRSITEISPGHTVTCKGKLKGRVRADKSRIAQVLINLLTNAFKYSPQGSNIFVHVERKGKKCIIAVQDFGPGIAKKDQHEIFTRFFRTEDSTVGDIAGVGLGLYISKEIVKKHHEKLWVKSVKGKGAMFSFTLPLA